MNYVKIQVRPEEVNKLLRDQTISEEVRRYLKDVRDYVLCRVRRPFYVSTEVADIKYEKCSGYSALERRVEKLNSACGSRIGKTEEFRVFRLYQILRMVQKGMSVDEAVKLAHTQRSEGRTEHKEICIAGFKEKPYIPIILAAFFNRGFAPPHDDSDIPGWIYCYAEVDKYSWRTDRFDETYTSRYWEDTGCPWVVYDKKPA